ncbi:MAG: exonuclease SbcCD subunit D [Anaerolineales bacterium]|nr:exonuclease SbcCD subunit D [Anaerolineales bacterium]
MSGLKVLHFADAHIDIANYGRQDAQTGLPVRVLDFLRSLDEIVDTAIEENVDLVVFGGDAYKDRNPAPTFQREWGRRMMRLSRADIPTLLLVGNHDVSPSLGRAHALEEYNTLDIPYVRVVSKPALLGPADLWDLPLQVIALPWVSKSEMIAVYGTDSKHADAELEERLINRIEDLLSQLDPELPAILLAHASVQGAVYGGERTVSLGRDLVLSPALVKSPALDYVALGHIHKKQDVNEATRVSQTSDAQTGPPVVYPGSIERVDFGEVEDDKFFVMVDLQKDATSYAWRQLKHIRTFIDRRVRLDAAEGVMDKIRAKLPGRQEMQDAIVRLTIDYPRELEPYIDESELREAASGTFEFHLIKRPQMEARLRIPEDKNVGDLDAGALLDLYWGAAHVEVAERETLSRLAQEIIQDDIIEEQPSDT